MLHCARTDRDWGRAFHPYIKKNHSDLLDCCEDYLKYRKEKQAAQCILHNKHSIHADFLPSLTLYHQLIHKFL